MVGTCDIAYLLHQIRFSLETSEDAGKVSTVNFRKMKSARKDTQGGNEFEFVCQFGNQYCKGSAELAHKS